MDSVLRDRSLATLNRTALFLTGLIVVRALLNLCGVYALRCAGERIVADLRKAIFWRLLASPIDILRSRTTGDWLSRLGNDATAIRSVCTETLVSGVLQFVTFAASVVLMIHLNTRLGLVLVFAVPTLIIASRKFGPRLKKTARAAQDRLAETMGIAEETLAAIHVVKGFAREEHEAHRFGNAVDACYCASRRSLVVGAFFSSTISSLFVIVNVLTFWFAGVEIMAHRLTAGDLVALLLYTQQISQTLGELMQAFGSTTVAIGALHRIVQLLNGPTEARGGCAVPPAAGVRGEIEFVNVGFSYGPSAVFTNLTFRVRPGERIALVGLSGAGKSTIVGLLEKFHLPSQGSVRIDGVDIHSRDASELRKRVALVTQDTFLFRASIRDNIRYGRLDATDADVERAARGANAHEFICRLPSGYDTVIGEHGSSLSGGERQRLAIARALLKDADIFLMDEPTSSVDRVSEQLISQAIQDIAKEKTVLVISHRMAVAAAFPRILVLADGRISEDGSHHALMQQRGLYWMLSTHNTEQCGAADGLPVHSPTAVGTPLCLEPMVRTET